MNEKTEVRCQRSSWGSMIDVAVFMAGSVAEPLTMREIKEGEYITPTLSITMGEAQALMDDLWACGLRPSEGTGSAGSLAATERHLLDMRKIAFGFLEVKE